MREPLARALSFAAALVTVAAPARAADDASAGYATVRPAIVKVWAFDRNGHPSGSGTGVVIVSNGARSLVLTAAHVVAGAATLAVDVDRTRHDLPAHVQQTGPRDLAVLALESGGLVPATFAPRARAVVEGNEIAVAGYVEHDELIGVVGQEPRLLFPGTVSSRPDGGAYLELENVHVEAGLSGGPVFDPATGDVLGIVTSRTADQRGGFADSAALVVEPFLAAHAIAFRERGDRRVANASSAPTPTPHPAVATAAPREAPPAAATRPTLALALPPGPAIPLTVPLPAPVPTVRVRATPAPLVLVTPEPAPSASPDEARVWRVADTFPRRFVYVHRGCPIVLSVAVRSLALSLPSTGDGVVDASLALLVGRHVVPVAACQYVAESVPSVADYRPTASSFDGRHLTIRFRYVPRAEPNEADAALYPSDISLDANVDANGDDAPMRAHVVLVDAEWNVALDVIAATPR